MSLIVLKRVLVALLGITIATVLLIACLAYSWQFKDITILRDQMIQQDHEVSWQYALTQLYSRSDEIESLFYHPAPLGELWVRINQYFVIRRLAYYDERNKSDVTILFISMHDLKKFNKKPDLYALLDYDDKRSSICVKLVVWTQVGPVVPKWGQYWVSYLLKTSSKIPTEIPLEIKLTTNVQCENLSVSFQVQSNVSKNYTFGICLHQPLYNLNDPQLLIDWIELNLALGAEIITVYFQSVPESFYDILLPYINASIVEVLDWNINAVLSGFTVAWGQTGLINECIYRNLYRVKYLALIDIDEFIIPQEKKYVKITDLLPVLERSSPKAASYVFFHTVFWSDGVSLPDVKFSEKCDKMKWPRYVTYTLRSGDPITDAKSHPNHKVIVKPQAMISGDVHGALLVKNGYTSHYDVPLNVGLLFHYRSRLRYKVPEKKERSFLMSRYFNQTLEGIQSHIC